MIKQWGPAVALALGLLVSCSSEADGPEGDVRSDEAGSSMQYPELHELVALRLASVGFDGLDRRERVIHCVWTLEEVVGTAGFEQFFRGAAGDRTAETREALDVIDAQVTKGLVERAVQVAFRGLAAPLEQEARVELLARENDLEDERLRDRLRQLDEAFCKHEEPLGELVNAWLRESVLRGAQSPQGD